jgi:hypothetical protein
MYDYKSKAFLVDSWAMSFLNWCWTSRLNMFFDYLLRYVLLGHALQYLLKVIDISLISQSDVE